MYLKSLVGGVLAAATLFVSSVAMAETVKTDYYTVELKDGWVAPTPAKSMGKDRLLAAYGNQQVGAAVTIMIEAKDLDPEKQAKDSRASFMKKGAKFDEIKEGADDTYYYSSTDPNMPTTFFSRTSDDVNASFIIMGNLDAANAFIDSFEDCDKDLFKGLEK